MAGSSIIPRLPSGDCRLPIAYFPWLACKQGTGVLGCASCAAGRRLVGRRLEMPLKITTKQVDGVTVVHCNGRIVFGEEAAARREQVKNLLTTQKHLVLNLGGVSYIDSGGLGTLVGLYTSARALGGDIKLANLTQRVGDQLQITKLVTVFEVFDSEEKAVTSYKTAATA